MKLTIYWIQIWLKFDNLMDKNSFIIWNKIDNLLDYNWIKIGLKLD